MNSSPKTMIFFMVEVDFPEDYSMAKFAFLLVDRGLETIGLTLFTP